MRRHPARRTTQPPNRAQKEAMLAAFVDYILDHGVADLSLRPAAAALGTSPRMLLYYFGSKEGLMAAAIAQARARDLATFDIEAQKWEARSPAQIFAAIWKWHAGERRAPYRRFFFEMYGIALQNPKTYRAFLRTVGTDFLSFIETTLVRQGFRRAEARAVATLHVASSRGLLLDLLTTGDRARIDAAAKLVAQTLERQLRGRSRRRPKRR